MARFSLYLVCGLVLGAVLVNAISQDPGYLLVTWGDWQLETSVWLALSALMLSLVLLWFVLRALRTTLRMPRTLRRWLGLRSARGAQRRADKGFAAFFEGHWDVAEKSLKKGGSPDEQTLLHPLYSALAALHQGESARALTLLEQAETEGSAPVSLITLARAECHLKAGATNEVERSLEQLSASERKTPRAKALRAEAAYLEQDWQPLTELLTDVRRAGIAPDEQINAWERESWNALLSEADDGASTAVSVWKRAPESLKAPGQSLWPALLDILRRDAQADALQKVLQERLQQHCESVTIDAMNGLSDKQLLKMKKALQRWRDEDSEGGCHAVLARIARIEGDAETEAAMWGEAHARHPSASHAVGWADCLRNQGKESEASALEAKALAALR
ncbi:MAG: tetratricopeptide repeat protein [Halieaceae bacterium]|nr:MAG: tetratricopeptide repeat protein [Halieaceae bacterium]